jgi:hypothetical protein
MIESVNIYQQLRIVEVTRQSKAYGQYSYLRGIHTIALEIKLENEPILLEDKESSSGKYLSFPGC